MDLKTMPKRAAAELLAFLAENEAFESVKEQLDGSMTVNEVKALFREMSVQLQQLALAEDEAGALAKNPHLSRKSKQLLSVLSVTEEKALIKAFDFNE
ncbi:MAG: hypothetical protein COV45_06080 [Deltaproteobacteria bacterium CG11_big_fil_rev_8_21_14_0_20_47_16]|nr:MAG: hypothetical protein COV45_06080 [Deltaproteobacteria bacterium CG11_big_fil_rev_8_21_14_0_20_47_16]